MKTAQTMLPCCARQALLAAFAAFLGVLASCAPKYTTPGLLTSPYAGGAGEVVWAVAPLRNESGVSIVDELAVSDALVNEAQQVRGVSVLPINRSLAAMRAIRLPYVNTPTEALALAKALGADGILVGTVTAYHPYDPPTLGLTLALYSASPSMHMPPIPQVDPVRLQSAPRETASPAPSIPQQPLAAVSRVFDASNGETREAVRIYAAGRHDPVGPLGWKRYTASMALYAKFACFEMTRQLLDEERARLGNLAARSDSVPAR